MYTCTFTHAETHLLFLVPEHSSQCFQQGRTMRCTRTTTFSEKEKIQTMWYLACNVAKCSQFVKKHSFHWLARESSKFIVVCCICCGISLITYGTQTDIHEKCQRVAQSVVRKSITVAQSIFHNPFHNRMLNHQTRNRSSEDFRIISQRWDMFAYLDITHYLKLSFCSAPKAFLLVAVSSLPSSYSTFNNPMAMGGASTR